MTRLLILATSLFLLSGCTFYLDNPPDSTIRGVVLLGDTPLAVPDCHIYVYNGRRIVGQADSEVIPYETDQNGKFEFTEKVRTPFIIGASKNALTGTIMIDSIKDEEYIIRIYGTKENQK